MPVTYEEFAKLEIRIGTVLAAELVPDTDKLLKCSIDFGEFGTRTIVSGIAQFRKPEDIIGKQLPYITNLAPRMLRGVESQGMLLAAALPDDGLPAMPAHAGHAGIALLMPDVVVTNGTRVK